MEPQQGIRRDEDAYDAASQLLEMQDTSGNSINTYDLDGRPASFTAPTSGVQLTYSYDPVGNRVGMTEVGSGLAAQTYTYDPVGNLTRIVDPFGQVTTFTYDRLERELQRLSATISVWCTHIYDPAGRETLRDWVTAPEEGPPVSSYGATYDSVGNRLTVSGYPDYSWDFTYDAANQLKTEMIPTAGDYSVSYTYDPAGNRNTLSKLVLPASRTVTTYSYDAANELTLAHPETGSPTTQTFDLNGNLLTQQIGSALTTYTWDYENRLTSIALSPGVTYPHGTIVTNVYDANGLRQAYQDSTGRSTFTYDGQSIWRADQPSATTNRCTQLPGAYGPLLARHQTVAGDTTHVYALGDLSDNVGMMYGGNSNLFTAFGNNLDSPGTGLFAFGGMLGYFIDPTTGLYYVRGRWYDPVTGRFPSRDPSGFAGGDWNNWYRYVWNNPVNWTDPSGLALSASGFGNDLCCFFNLPCCPKRPPPGGGGGPGSYPGLVPALGACISEYSNQYSCGVSVFGCDPPSGCKTGVTALCEYSIGCILSRANCGGDPLGALLAVAESLGLPEDIANAIERLLDGFGGVKFDCSKGPMCDCFAEAICYWLKHGVSGPPDCALPCLAKPNDAACSIICCPESCPDTAARSQCEQLCQNIG